MPSSKDISFHSMSTFTKSSADDLPFNPFISLNIELAKKKEQKHKKYSASKVLRYRSESNSN